MSDSVQPHRWQPTRLPSSWDSPGKNTGVACHFPLQGMKVKSESEVTQSCPTLSDPMDYSLPGSSIHGFFRQEYWSGVPLPSLQHGIAWLLKSKARDSLHRLGHIIALSFSFLNFLNHNAGWIVSAL